MIFRISTGRANCTEAANQYTAFLDGTVFPQLRTISGHEGAYLLRRSQDAGVEMVIITIWDSLDAIGAFAGADIDAAIFEPEARRLLPDRDDRVRHYEVVLDGR